MSDIDPESLEIFNQFLVRRNREIEEKQRLRRKALEDRKRDWATASTVRLVPVQSIDVDLDVARLCIDSAGRLVVSYTPGETPNHSPGGRRRAAALGLETLTEIDYSLLDVELRDETGTVDRLRLRDIPTSHTRAETLRDGGFVVTSSRTGFHESAWAHNVWIVDADGPRVSPSPPATRYRRSASQPRGGSGPAISTRAPSVLDHCLAGRALCVGHKTGSACMSSRHLRGVNQSLTATR